MKTSALIAALTALVLCWTGTFLHDHVIDQLGCALLDHAPDHEFQHAAHVHDHSGDCLPSIAPAAMHEHEPFALSVGKWPRDPVATYTAPVSAVFLGVADAGFGNAAASFSCRQRPPPRTANLPTYLLFHAMLI